MIDLSLLDEMISPDSQTRTLALKGIGDSIEFNIWDPLDLVDIVEELMDRLSQEPVLQIRILIFKNLINALVRYSVKVDCTSLIDFLEQADIISEDLSFALQVLGYTHQPEYKPMLEGYLKHSDEMIRLAAKEALRVL